MKKRDKLEQTIEAFCNGVCAGCAYNCRSCGCPSSKFDNQDINRSNYVDSSANYNVEAQSSWGKT